MTWSDSKSSVEKLWVHTFQCLRFKRVPTNSVAGAAVRSKNKLIFHRKFGKSDFLDFKKAAVKDYRFNECCESSNMDLRCCTYVSYNIKAIPLL